MAELPVALWVLFVVFTIPMIDMATIGLRSTFVVSAAHDAAHAAARAKSYLVGVDASDPSAVTMANTVVTQDCDSFAEIKVTNVTTSLVVTNITTDATTWQTTPLAQAADINNNTYSIEVAVTATVTPFITFNVAGFLPSVPGLSAPITVTCRDQEFSEYPQGLNQ